MRNSWGCKSVLTLLSLIVVANLTACSDGGGKSSRQVVRSDLSKYSEASCKFAYDEGPSAFSHPSNVQTSYFGKRINTGHLRSVLRASAAGVIRYAESLNVKFFKSTIYNPNNCEIMASLPEAPQDLEVQFLKLEGILGLYLSMKSPNMPSTNQRAAILVRRDANKWVLVHEFMHHLFQLQIEKEVGLGYDIKSAFLKSVQDYERAAGSLSNGDNRQSRVNNAAEKLVALSDLTIPFVKQYMLEEMTIETVLGERLDSGELALVVPEQRINGAAYILDSGSKAKNFLIMIAAEVDKFEREFQSEIKQNLRLKLNNFSVQTIRLIADIDALNTRADNFLRNQGLEYHGLKLVSWHPSSSSDTLVSDHQQNHHTGCAHSHEADEVMARVADALSKM